MDERCNESISYPDKSSMSVMVGCQRPKGHSGLHALFWAGADVARGYKPQAIVADDPYAESHLATMAQEDARRDRDDGRPA